MINHPDYLLRKETLMYISNALIKMDCSCLLDVEFLYQLLFYCMGDPKVCSIFLQ
jgi:hypothetical protein